MTQRKSRISIKLDPSTPLRNALVLVMVAILLGCGLLVKSFPPPEPSPTQAVSTPGSEWYSVYFTDPHAPTARTMRGGIDSELAAAIDNARLSIDVAAYDLDLWSVRNALLAAHKRGAGVRVVTDSDYLDNPEVQDLIEAGVPVLGDRREGLMHNKFAVLDRLEVWSGSMNFTLNGAYRNNNNLVRLRSSRLAEDYLAEFDEMFVDDLFGPGSPADTPHPRLTIEGIPVEVYFSPDDGTARRLVELIDSARQSVYFLAFSVTSDEISQAMLDRARAGVTVAGVFENSQAKSNMGGEFERLSSAGLDVRLDGNPRNMHHKVIIIDGNILVTGSYNFSASAEERNDENTLIFHDPAIASLYLDEFNRIYAEAR
jgi:phosphatidylserine/phosphatidylglycerophosphate/cardiolipin synthase-like enzyme